MRFDFCLATLQHLPAATTAPREGHGLYVALRAAGYRGVQTHSMAGVLEAGLVGTAFAMVSDPCQVDEVASVNAGQGFDSTQLVAGNGLEDDADAAHFAEAVVAAAQRRGHRLLLETHRASITQDIRRTIDLIRRFPELRFTADFSHWYTGHEMAMGDFMAKLDFIQPLIERTLIVEGRIGNVNCAQVPIEGLDDQRHFIRHHTAFWSRCFAARIAAGDEPVFAPQLLPAVIHAHGMDWPIDYAQLTRAEDGQWREEGDRWEQSLLLCRLAESCLPAGESALATSSSGAKS